MSKKKNPIRIWLPQACFALTHTFNNSKAEFNIYIRVWFGIEKWMNNRVEPGLTFRFSWNRCDFKMPMLNFAHHCRRRGRSGNSGCGWDPSCRSPSPRPHDGGGHPLHCLASCHRAADSKLMRIWTESQNRVNIFSANKLNWNSDGESTYKCRSKIQWHALSNCCIVSRISKIKLSCKKWIHWFKRDPRVTHS